MTTYSAVRTTGIYCRPGCGAKPRAENITTFELAAAAEAAGYRACLRCRPYRISGPLASSAPELVCRAVRLILAGALDEDNEAALGRRIGVSARHLRRLFNDHVGATPSQLALSRRAHFARRMLDDTDLTIAQVAFASGFGSVRHFNRAMREVFRASPRELRDRRRRHDRLTADGGLALRIPFDPPYDWDAALRLLARTAVPGVESVHDGSYRRTIVLDGDPGVLEIGPGGPDHLLLRAHLPYWEGLIHVVERVVRLVGIDVDVSSGESFLAGDPVLGPLIRARPGVRPPGAWGPFEAGVQAIVAQSLGPRAAREALGGIVRAYGTHVPGLPYDLTHAFPSAQILADADLGDRLPDPVAKAVASFASAVATEDVRLDGAADLDDLVWSLVAITGVTPEIAQRIAFRLGHLDAAPPVSGVRTEASEAASEGWRPWRALAAAHLLADPEADPDAG